MKTKDECRKMIFKAGIKLGVSPKLISLGLLNELDKSDLMQGLVSQDALESYAEVWRDSGMLGALKEVSIPLESKKGCLSRQSHFEKMRDACRYRTPFYCPPTMPDCYCQKEKTCRLL